jgi:membrane associated rhomboid family serine protease
MAAQRPQGIAPLTIDRCPRCQGLWLDVGEVTDLRETAAKLREAQLDPQKYARDVLAQIAEKQQSGAVDAEVPSERAVAFSWFLDVPLRGFNPLVRTPIVTWLLILACAAAFLAQTYLGASFTDRWISIPSLVVQWRELERVLTSMFLHANLIHLVGNLYFLKLCGDNVEDRLGRTAYLLLYVAGGVAAEAVFSYLNPSPGIRSLGASGAISAVLGMYLVFFPHARFKVRFNVGLGSSELASLPSWLYLGFWFAFQTVASLSEGGGEGSTGVAWSAHIGGFIAGLAFAFLARLILPDARIAALARKVGVKTASLASPPGPCQPLSCVVRADKS